MLDRADTLLVMTCAALALLATPAMGLFFAGMVRRKNALSAALNALAALGIVAIQWTLAGRGLAFGPDAFGGLVGLPGGELGPRTGPAGAIPGPLFSTFHLLTAAFAAALVVGGGAERMRFAATALLALLWTTFVYDPLAHWAWSPDGWLNRLGARDFAGGLVVHAAAGASALCVAVAVGRRRGADVEELLPHDLTLTAAGTALAWFAWAGLNVGHAWGVSASAVAAFGATVAGGAAGMAAWSVVESATAGKVTFLGACTGVVAGLVGVSAAAGHVGPAGALALGAAAALAAHGAIRVKGRLGCDDPLDVFGVHGVGGVAGALGLGLLAESAIDPGVVGLVEGRAELILAQLAAAAAVVAYAVVATSLLLLLVDRAVGLRVSAEDEELGLDLSQHGQRGG